MRRTLALTVAGLGLAMSFLPVAPASAVCSYFYEQLTGHCDPCFEVASTWNRVNALAFGELPYMYCD